VKKQGKNNDLLIHSTGSKPMWRDRAYWCDVKQTNVTWQSILMRREANQCDVTEHTDATW